MIFALMLALIYFGNASIFRPMRLDRDAKVLRVGLRRLPVDWISGNIVDYSQRSVSRTETYTPEMSPSGYQADPIHFHKHDRYESFSVDTPEGRQPISVASINDMFRFEEFHGQKLTALWVTVSGTRWYLGFRVPKHHVDHPETDWSITTLTKPHFWTVVPAIVLGYIVGNWIALFEFFGVLCMFIAMPVYGASLSAIAGWRRGKFRYDEVRPTMLALAGETESKGSGLFLSPALEKMARDVESRRQNKEPR